MLDRRKLTHPLHPDFSHELGIITAVILLFIGTLAWMLTSRIPVMELPSVDLSEIDPMIISQIQQAEGKIKQDPSLSASAWQSLGLPIG